MKSVQKVRGGTQSERHSEEDTRHEPTSHQCVLQMAAAAGCAPEDAVDESHSMPRDNSRPVFRPLSELHLSSKYVTSTRRVSGWLQRIDLRACVQILDRLF